MISNPCLKKCLPSTALNLAFSLSITLFELTNPEGDYDSDNKKWYWSVNLTMFQ